MTDKTIKKPVKKAPTKAKVIKEEPTLKETNATTTTKSVTPAKAGKRSAKAIEAAEVKLAKKERAKSTVEVKPEAPKISAKTTRSRLERRSKAYKKKYELVDKTKLYTLKEATDLVVKTSPTKFDASVELHLRLAVDPKQADQNIRDNVVLPAGSGKSVKVAVYIEDNDIVAANAAGADLVGIDAVTKELESGNFSFDILISTSSQMPKLAKYARILGPRGLMPNPKSGTVTNDFVKAIKESKAGKVEYRVDSNGIIHIGFGKVSFTPAQLLENLEAVILSIQNNKPASIKSAYITSGYLSTSMGPSIKLAL